MANDEVVNRLPDENILEKALERALDRLHGEGKKRSEMLARQLRKAIPWTYEALVLAVKESRLDENGLQQFAVWLLSRIPDDAVGNILRGVAVDDDNSHTVRAEAVKGLSMHESEEHRESLERLAMQDEDEIVRIISISTLGELPYKRGTQDLLLRILGDDDEPSAVRAAVPEALSMATPAARDEALSVLRRIVAAGETHPDVRFMAVFALGEARDRAAVGVLRDVAKASENHVSQWGSVQDEAREALESIGAD